MSYVNAQAMRAIENRAALSRAVELNVEGHDLLALVSAAFNGYARVCEMRDATTTATELRALADQVTSHPQMFGPAIIRINSVGMVIAVGFALVGFSEFLHTKGAQAQALKVFDVVDQLAKAIPEDWDCGFEDCEACATYRMRVASKFQ
jgi:hypothetical protein